MPSVPQKSQETATGRRKLLKTPVAQGFHRAAKETVSMRQFLKWIFILTLSGLVVGFLFLLIVLQAGRCDEVGNVERPDCVLYF